MKDIHTVVCDACSEMIPAEAQEKRLSGGGVEQVLFCGHCGAEYPIARITAKGLELRARLTSLRQGGRQKSGAFRRTLRSYRKEVEKL